MTTLAEVIKTLKNNKERLFSKYGLRDIAVFGSYSRQSQTEQSDIDILVDFRKPVGVEFIDLANELEDLLNNKVDLVSKNGIKSDYFKKIESELSYV